ncbi:NADPH-dependent FMN reductase [Mycobacteroides chelonae]|nr:FMN reductase [Mycobacterium sp. QIA-37]
MAEKVAEKNVLAIVGSLRKASLNRQLAEAAAESAPAGVSVNIFEGLADLPHYNEDIDGDNAPASVESLRTAVADADAVLLVSPENNGTVSSALKNALDWLSRPFGSSVFKGKPTVVIGTSAGRYGGIWAIDDTRKVASIATANVLDDIKVAVPSSAFDGKHPREHAETVAELTKALDALTSVND